ncbi:class I SAM-dependent methyltransferase [Saccharopolyspora griseoalba]|uniref:Class I SAM-dependent methyltransferase n=1 Tax=Saccharopolyspora griseoalba TaxID=1431848 RepID=A0ABW2LCK6_9PSEU
MTASRVDFSGVPATMLKTLHLRALDAGSANPVLGDHHAAQAVRRIDHDWRRLDKRGAANAAYAVALRGRIFDDLVAEFLRQHPTAVVLNLACGLDSRAFRLQRPAGSDWFDVDLPEVVELRRDLYAEEARYRMLAGSVTDPRWLGELPAHRPALVVAEGLMMYLTPERNWELLRRLTEHFDTGEVLFDGVAPWVATTTQVLKGYFHRWYRSPAYLTSHRHYPGIIAETPRLRHIADVGVLSDTDAAPDPSVRRYYRIVRKLVDVEDSVRVFRTGF